VDKEDDIEMANPMLLIENSGSAWKAIIPTCARVSQVNVYSTIRSSSRVDKFYEVCYETTWESLSDTESCAIGRENIILQ
jgi:hypothetical protein